jgi:protein SCO1/2
MLKLDAGRDFEIVTVSFEPKETPELAARQEGDLPAALQASDRGGGLALPDRRCGCHRASHRVGRLQVRVGSGGTAVRACHRHRRAHARRPHRALFLRRRVPAQDLRLGLVEAADGKIGNVVDQVLLYCFHYDPATGKYGASVIRLIRLAAVLVLVALGAS